MQERYSLNFILKVTDQCNLHCPYCYYYSGENASLRTRKFKDRDDRLKLFADTMRTSQRVADAGKVMVVLHGGEPLLLPIESMRAFLERLTDHDWGSRLFISLQTNGVLLNDDWVDLLGKHRVSVNVSIDGPPEIHDKNRPNAVGAGSYAGAVKGLKLLQSAAAENKIVTPSILAVYTRGVSGKTYFDHFVKDLVVKDYDILFPDDALTDTNLLKSVVPSFRKMTQETWHEWLDHDDPKIKIRFIDYALKAVGLNRPAFDYRFQHVAVVDLKGDVFFEDSLRTQVSLERLKIGNWIEEGLDKPLEGVAEVAAAAAIAPDGCEGCSVLHRCAGGELSNRYVLENGRFGRPATCDIYKSHFAMASKLIAAHTPPAMTNETGVKI